MYIKDLFVFAIGYSLFCCPQKLIIKLQKFGFLFKFLMPNNANNPKERAQI